LSHDDATGSGARPQRAPGIAIAAVSGFIVLILLFVVFGAGGGEDPPPPEPNEALVAADTGDLAATTTTLPPRLSDLLPVEMERLSIVSGSDDPRTTLWGPSDRFARSYRLPFAPMEAWFGADGTSIAFLDSQSTLFVGPAPGDGASKVAEMVSAARFHPTKPAELAYTTASASSDSTALYRVLAEPGLLGGIEPVFITELPAASRLLTWGDWGFAVAIDDPAAVLILDPDGRPQRVMAGTAYAGGGDVILVDSTNGISDDRAAVASLAPIVVDPEPTVAIVDATFDPIFLFPGTDADISNVTISSDGGQIAVATFTDTGGTSLTIRVRSEATVRTIRIDSIVRPIGFVAGGTHLAMQDAQSGELVVANWRTGAHYRIAGLSDMILAIHF